MESAGEQREEDHRRTPRESAYRGAAGQGGCVQLHARALHDGRRVYSSAIVGMSPRPGAFGMRSFENLAHFSGEVFLVNAKYDRIADRPCYPSLSSLPKPPSLEGTTTSGRLGSMKKSTSI